LLDFSNALAQEEARSLAEGLSEEQLAIFDIFTRSAPDLSDNETAQVKRVAAEEILDRLPDAFTRPIYAQKCDVVYQHVFDSYWDDGSVTLQQHLLSAAVSVRGHRSPAMVMDTRRVRNSGKANLDCQNCDVVLAVLDGSWRQDYSASDWAQRYSRNMYCVQEIQPMARGAK
jgi:hypothetical protein